jgi:hypothetical protein
VMSATAADFHERPERALAPWETAVAADMGNAVGPLSSMGIAAALIGSALSVPTGFRAAARYGHDEKSIRAMTPARAKRKRIRLAQRAARKARRRAG